MVMLIFHKQVSAFWSNWFLAHTTLIGNGLCKASLTEGVMFIHNVLLAGKRHVTVVASKVLYVPGFFQCFRKLANVNKLQKNSNGIIALLYCRV